MKQEKNETPDVQGETDNTEAFADGPEVVDVETTMSEATANFDVEV